MRLEDIIKILIDNEVLIDNKIKRDSILSKKAIRLNKILKGLIGLDIYTKLAKGPRQNETKKEFLSRAFQEGEQ